MSVVLGEEKQSEYPLIAFTTLEPAALGVALCALIGAFFAQDSMVLAMCAWVFSSVGMVASVVHLAKPLRAPRSLSNLKSSWLSREIVAVAVFWALLSLWVAACWLDIAWLAIAADAAAVAAGAALMFVISRAYKVSTRPAWCGPEGTAELFATALGVGSAVSFALTGNAPVLFYWPLAALAACGLVIDVLSHRARRARLESLVEASDERVPLTLAQYEKLWPAVRRLWILEGASCVALLIAAALSTWGAAVMPVDGALLAAHAIAGISALAQIYVHAAHRNIFYELPVQVRFVKNLRK